MDRIKRDFTTLTWVMIPVAIAVNIAIGQLIVALKIPIYLDSIGTVLVAVMAGPIAGLLTGLLTNLIWGFSGINPIYAPFAITAAVIGLLAGLFASRGWFKKVYLWVLAGLITGVVAAIISAPIAAYMFGGVTGTGQDFLVAMFRATGASVLQATFGQGIVADPLDKLATFVVVWLIIKALPKRFLMRFPRAEEALGEGQDSME
jgi:energy-coupling factor transport system substrate-specific component